jgi:hypothetical protein
MKTLLLTALFSISFFNNYGQCTENATNFGNNTSTTSYNVSGDINVMLNTHNSITINFASNYSTASGPDVRLYLIKSEGRSVAELKSLNPTSVENISFGLVGFSGAQSFTESISNTIDITQYDTVFFYCLQFNAFWDIGFYSPFSSSNCAILDIDTFSVDTITVYPNPAKNQIHISNVNAVSAEIRIFNVLGKQVFHQSKITNNTIDVASFDKGIYLVKIDVDGKAKTQKLVIQ